MSDSADDPNERAWMVRIERSLQAIEQWHKRTGSAESPEPGSRLATDDMRNPSHPASLIAWSSIAAAVDHLGLAGDAIMREGGVRLRPTAFYNVCRAALVAASQAIWVMTGTQGQRLRRVQLLELEEAKSAKEFYKDYVHDVALEGDTSSELVAQMKQALGQREARERELRTRLKPQRGEGSVTSTLRAASEVVTASHDDAWVRRAFMFEWRTASADSHARLWHVGFRPGSRVPLLGDGTYLRMTTATFESYGQALGLAVMATSEAWRLWDQQHQANAV